ncbi:MAG TPA: hypothetical protein VLA04_04325 [Verrucomicrobiae bacterium]|nr:hypothetical protein [Verrucomicrobiae bacterium]
MKKFGLFSLLALALVGCGGSGDGGVPDTNPPGTADMPASTANFLALAPGPMTIRYAEGTGTRDMPVNLKFTHTDPDGVRLGLIESAPNWPMSFGFSGSLGYRDGMATAGLRQGDNNASGMADNLHAQVIDLRQMIEEYNASVSRGLTRQRNTFRTPFYVPAGVLNKFAAWKGADRTFVPAPTGAPSATTRGGTERVRVSQGSGLVFMYSPYLYASGCATYQVDKGNMLTLAHGINTFSGPTNLPVYGAHSYRMNDGTLAGLPDMSRQVGVATKSLNYSTVVELDAEVVINGSTVKIFDTDGQTVLGQQGRWFARDTDGYMVCYANMVNLVMMVPQLIETAYGSQSATGTVKVKLDIPLKSGQLLTYSAGFGGEMDAPLTGALSDVVSNWVSSMTFEAGIISNFEDPAWDQVVLRIYKA